MTIVHRSRALAHARSLSRSQTHSLSLSLSRRAARDGRRPSREGEAMHRPPFLLARCSLATLRGTHSPLDPLRRGARLFAARRARLAMLLDRGPRRRLVVLSSSSRVATRQSPHVWPLTRAAAYLFSPVINLTGIPVFSIVVRYNLLQEGLCEPRAANVIAVGMPWALALGFYAGNQVVADCGWTAVTRPLISKSSLGHHHSFPFLFVRSRCFRSLVVFRSFFLTRPGGSSGARRRRRVVLRRAVE